MYAEYKRNKVFVSEACVELSRTTQTFFDIYTKSINRNKKNISTIFYNEKNKLKSYKYTEFDKNTRRFANTISLKLNNEYKHSVVILKVANNPHWPEVFYSILMSGYKPLLLDAKTNKEGTANIISQSHAAAIITNDINNYDIKKINFDELIYSPLTNNNFKELWENEIILCSSGTTGDVKLIVMDGSNISSQINSAINIPDYNKDLIYPSKKKDNIRILSMIPFHHVFGLYVVAIWYLFFGAAIVYPNGNTPTEILKSCQDSKITHVYSVPLFWDSLSLSVKRKNECQDPKTQAIFKDFTNFNLGKITRQEAGIASKEITKKIIQNQILGSHIKSCISGGGYLSSETLTFINSLGYPLYNGYGMTELGVVSVEQTMNLEERLKGSIGAPWHNYTLKINGDKKQGELLIKSPVTHKKIIVGGIPCNPELDADGYFHTGDIASKDERGAFYIKGRIKDIIINSDGENIFPDELEIYFKNLPHISHLCVLGVSSKDNLHEDIVLVIETDNSVTDASISQMPNLIKEIERELPHNVKIADTYLSKKPLPLANNMKVKRYIIKKELQSNSKNYVKLGEEKTNKCSKTFSEEINNDILNPIKQIFGEVLTLPSFKIENDAHWINDLGGDSMNYVEAVLKIQEKFNITFPEEILGQISCVNEFVVQVAKLLGRKIVEN